MLLQAVMGWVVILFHGRVFARAVQACDLAIRPGRVGVGQPRGKAILLPDASNEMVKGLDIALALGARNAVIGQPRVDLLGHGGHHVPEAWRRAHCMGFFMPCGIGKVAGPVQGNHQGERACFRAHRRDRELAVADRRGLELLLGRLLAPQGRSAAEAMPLQAARQRGAGHVRPRGWHCRQAVITRHQCVLATRAHQRCCRHRQYGGARWLRTHRGIVPLGQLLPLRHGVGVQVITGGQRG